MTEQDRPSALRSWLVRYKPDRVRCTLRNGELRELPKPSTTRGQWTQLEHAINLLSPSYLEAFRGKELVAARALEGEDDADATVPAAAQENPVAMLVAGLPTIVQLIVEAGDASAMRHMEAYKLAFDSQLQLVKILSDRLGGLERAWHKMMLDRAAQVGSPDDQNDSAAMNILGNILGAKNGHGGPSSSSPPKETPDD